MDRVVPDRVARRQEDVLIVEDEVVSRRALTQLLAASGYTTKAVASAEEAIDLLDHSAARPGVALVDLDLPGMNGLELIARLGAMSPAVRPVLITAADPDSEPVRNRGPVSYLRKPIEFKDLLSLLAAVPERH